MSVKKRPQSPRQKMINLLYIVLMAMLALNVSSDVLKGFVLVGESLRRSTEGETKENLTLYESLKIQLETNPVKVRPWYDKAMEVKGMSDSLYDYAEELKWRIARAADGKTGNPDKLRMQDDLEASNTVMISSTGGQGKKLYAAINDYRERILTYISDERQREIVSSNLSTEVPQTAANKTLRKNWVTYMFEEMPAIAAITMLSKLQNDVRTAEGMVLHSIASNVDIKDIRVNELEAYVLPEATTLTPGQTFSSHIFMAAVDTTQRPEIYVNDQRISDDGVYQFPVGQPGEYSFSGYILLPNAAGELIRREFTQKYNVIAPQATVAADLMNVLYAGFDNPISISASGIGANQIQVSMSGGTLTSSGQGKYTARPAAVGQDVTFTVSGEVNGVHQAMGSFTFKVRKLPDPTAYIAVGTDHFTGGRIAKADILGAQQLGAAIDDGLLNIPFRVLGFETVFFDNMGNVRPEVSNGPNFTDAQKTLMRSLTRGKRFYISSVRAIGPDGLERTLPTALEVIIN